MKYCGLTDIGQRTSNEDAFLVKELSGGLLLASVIDGCGAAGGIAQLVMEKLNNESWLDNTAIEDAESLTVQLANIIIDVNNYIVDYRRYCHNVGCCCITAAIIVPADNVIVVCHIGDTRAYINHDGTILKLTQDHSPIGRLLDCGAILESEAICHPYRNRIDRALGMQQLSHGGKYVFTTEFRYTPGDTLMLCTDGIYDPLMSADIQYWLGQSVSTQQKAQELLYQARTAKSADNASIIVVDL